jgi:hypothetical protein
MKVLLKLLILLFIPFIVLAQLSEIWYKIEFNESNLKLLSYAQEGIIEADTNNPGTGWMTKDNFMHYSSHFKLKKLGDESRLIHPIISKINLDSIWQVLAIYPLPFQVESVRGLGFDGEYFFITDA